MSERKWIEVSREGHGSGPWVMVAPVDARGNEHAPVAVNRSALRDAPDDEQLRRDVTDWQHTEMKMREERDALRDRVAELERECAQWREHTERRGDEIDGWMGRANDLGIERDRLVRERDEARREAGELRQELGELQEGVDHLRAENERLQRETSRRREAGNVLHRRVDALRWGLGTREAPPHIQDALDGWAQVDGEGPDQPAPQTHYRVGDLVLSTDGPVRLVRLVRIQSDAPGVEHWKADPLDVALPPGERAILERDGIPTDEGLRRLAERAGRKLAIHPFTSVRFGIHETEVVFAKRATDDDRRGLAAALREMGGA